MSPRCSAGHYPTAALAAHAIGYLNEVSADELKTRKDEGYQAGDPIGRTGIERQWEPYLRGQKGFEKVVVNRRGLRRTDVRIPDLSPTGRSARRAVPGNNLVLTLDLDLQRIVERALRTGARRRRSSSTSTPAASWPSPPSRPSTPT